MYYAVTQFNKQIIVVHQQCVHIKSSRGHSIRDKTYDVCGDGYHGGSEEWRKAYHNMERKHQIDPSRGLLPLSTPKFQKVSTAIS